VAYPQHPLNRQIVKVLKREGRYWIIEKADGSQEKLPLAWAETVPSIIAQANRQNEPWAEVTELLNLVKIVERLRVQPPALQSLVKATSMRSLPVSVIALGLSYNSNEINRLPHTLFWTLIHPGFKRQIHTIARPLNIAQQKDRGPKIRARQPPG
jgi:hypothetical protein